MKDFKEFQSMLINEVATEIATRITNAIPTAPTQEDYNLKITISLILEILKTYHEWSNS